jgi:hypothetical protein
VTKSRHVRRLGQLGLSISILLGGLAACGDEEDEPTPTPSVAATAAVILPSGDATPQSGSGSTVGTLADRIGAAWAGVTTYRAVTTANTGGATPQAGTAPTGASPTAAGPVTELIDEIVLPDRKRRIARANGALQYELISVGGKLLARGPAAPGLDPSRPDPTAWVEIDPAMLTPGASDFVEDYAGFVAPVAAPYSGLAPEERDREAVPLGDTTVEGRACQAYRIADTTNTGERIEIVLSLGEDDLPCSIETRAGGLATTTVFAYNIPLTVEAPDVATPAPSGR